MPTTTPFLLLCLPLLATKEVFKFASTYELFLFSTLSKRAKQKVKLVSSQRELCIDLSTDYRVQLFNSLGDCLIIEPSRYKVQFPAIALKLNTGIVQAGIDRTYMRDRFSSTVRISIFWKDKAQGVRSLLKQLLETFKIGTLELNNSNKDKNDLIEMTVFLKTTRPIDKLNAMNRNYTFGEIINFMPTRQLSIQYPRWTYKNFIALFKIWMEGHAAQEISFYKCPKSMSIRPLALLVDGKPEVTEEPGLTIRSFEVTRNDGLNGRVAVYKALNSIRFWTLQD